MWKISLKLVETIVRYRVHTLTHKQTILSLFSSERITLASLAHPTMTPAEIKSTELTYNNGLPTQLHPHKTEIVWLTKYISYTKQTTTVKFKFRLFDNHIIFITHHLLWWKVKCSYMQNGYECSLRDSYLKAMTMNTQYYW